MKEKMAKYVVTVDRTGYATREIEVEAMSEDQAREIAEDTAGGFEFREHYSDYEITDCRKTEKEVA